MTEKAKTGQSETEDEVARWHRQQHLTRLMLRASAGTGIVDARILKRVRDRYDIPDPMIAVEEARLAKAARQAVPDTAPQDEQYMRMRGLLLLAEDQANAFGAQAELLDRSPRA